MKRSKMVNILREAFLEHMNCGENCCKNDDMMYSKILNVLEINGMKPPKIFNPDKRGGTPIFILKWEEEN